MCIRDSRKIEELKAQGISIIYISHKMEEVFRIADDITVLRDGAVVSTDRAEDLDLDTVIARMVGRKLDNVYPKETVPIGDKALEIKGFSQKDLFEDINFHVAKGEIVGFAGLVGAGRTDVYKRQILMRTISSISHILTTSTKNREHTL